MSRVAFICIKIGYGLCGNSCAWRAARKVKAVGIQVVGDCKDHKLAAACFGDMNSLEQS
jgi:hypothetical protein